jgi:hypothetical protein
VSIAGSGTTATVTHTGHGLVTGQKVLIGGVTDDDVYNGVFTITYVSTTSYTYTTPAAITKASPAGTITATYVVMFGLTNSSGILSEDQDWSVAQVVSGRVRKSSASPYYQQSLISGSISTTSGLDITIFLIKDE